MKRLTIFSSIISLACAASLYSVEAVSCQNDIKSTTPNEDFTVHNDGTVTHNATGLMWMRCSFGQDWDGSDCSSPSFSYTWERALVEARNNNYADYNDWRLPNINELASIVEESCVQPSINIVIFPNTAPSASFWSSSPSATNLNSVLGVNFSIGAVGNVGNKSQSLRGVRFVRDAK